MKVCTMYGGLERRPASILFDEHECAPSVGQTLAIIPQTLAIILILSRGNRTPGSRDAPGYNSLVVQATRCSSFQLTHMSREDHVRSIDPAMASKGKTKTYYSAHNFASTVSFSMWASVYDSDHGCVVRIFVGPS